jgi:uroporphyrinogen decarboxylase
MIQLERVSAALEGRRPDRPPVSFWYHFPPEVTGTRLVEAHLRHVETYDLDFLKVMADGRYPLPGGPDAVIETAGDLDRLTVLAGDEGAFGQQIELLRALSRRLGGRLRMTTTVFNAWATLRRLTAPDSDVHRPPTLLRTTDHRDATLSRLLGEAPAAVGQALGTIARSLANFSRNCLAAGADGIYLSVRDDWVDTPENGTGVYDRLVRPHDLEILAAAGSGTFNIVHICGTALDFKRFAAYPTAVLHWADRVGGPAIAEVAPWARPALCAGVDHLRTLVSGTPADCRREVLDAVRQAGNRPLIIAPGCTFDPEAVPAENLHAVRLAVEAAS